LKPPDLAGNRIEGVLKSPHSRSSQMVLDNSVRLRLEKSRTVSRMSSSSAAEKLRPEKETSVSGMDVLLFSWFSYPIRKERECPAQNALKRRNFMSGVPRRFWMTQIAGISRQECAGSPPSGSAEEMPIKRAETADTRYAKIRKIDKRMG
jgi:hypothetical protein